MANIIDLDVGLNGDGPGQQVASPRTLQVGINDGQQIFDETGDGGLGDGANRLLIFTGTALCNLSGPSDGTGLSAIIRVRLQCPIPGGVIFKGSATVAGLASIHGTDDDDDLFGANKAKTVVGPTDGQKLPNNKSLPENELYVSGASRVFH